MFNCKAFTNHLCLTVNGNLQPCCRFEGSSYNFDYKLPTYNNLEIKDNWVKGCEKCLLEEKSLKKSSYREFINSILSDTIQIEYLELSISNHCNLACKMCNPDSSSLWNTLLDSNNELHNYMKKGKKTKIDIDNLFKSIDLSNLKYLKYLGGEPFITPELEHLFIKLKKLNLTKNITFLTNTNVTFFPHKLLKYIDEFKNVKVALSVDGIGKLNDYIRYGKDWETVSKNINLWKLYSNNKLNINIYFHTTVQAYNIHNLTEIKNYCKDNEISYYPVILRRPEHLSINALPQEYINKITNEDNLEYIKNYKFDIKLYKKFLNYTKLLDKMTNLNFKQINSEWNYF